MASSSSNPTTSTTDASLGHVSSATYPLPEPLVIRLKAGVLFQPPAPPQEDEAHSSSAGGGPGGAGSATGTRTTRTTTTTTTTRRGKVDDASEALAQLVGNSIEALDAMYFATPARIRKHPAFSHRLCLRVRASPTDGTLSLTDLGVGMTRADLINSLGIGRANLLSSSSSSLEVSSNGRSSNNNNNNHNNGSASRGVAVAAAAAAVPAHHSSTASRADTDSTATDIDEEEEDLLDDDYDDQQQHHHPRDEPPQPLPPASSSAASNGISKPLPSHSLLSCRATDLGGFYAALCSLGVGVRVGTKAKHDEYYEFEVGQVHHPTTPNGTVHAVDHEDATSLLERFCIRRPYPEGVALTAETGFDQFQDVRGDSGTCVTLYLNDEAIASGLLDETTLRPLFLHLLQTTQYTVAFSSDDSATAIIEASGHEQLAMEVLLQEPEDPLDAVADMDLGPKRGGGGGAAASTGSHNSVKERAKYIPLRLSLGERKMLRLVEAAMCCCEYTTDVDRPFKSAARRTHEQLRGVTSILRGLVTACDYEAGQKLLKNDDNSFATFDKFFRQMFEIARRHKIMNPEKMRTEYGKLVYLLQDAVSPSIKPHLGFSVNGPIQSVYKFLESRGGLDLLSDALIETATEEILAERKSRATIEHEIKQKERAVAVIKRKYKTARLSTDDIHLCLYSICDNNSFLNSNRVPIDKIIDYLTTHFSPTHVKDGYSLSIVSGEDGARLSHSHERQYYYALQSLTLWRDIVDDMFRLWAMAEEDLLSESIQYALQDTGQGMQRVQQSPRTYQAMQRILQRVQQKVSHWVGSGVIHMGDHNVPNALSFIDKYTQGEPTSGNLAEHLYVVTRG